MYVENKCLNLKLAPVCSMLSITVTEAMKPVME